MDNLDKALPKLQSSAQSNIIRSRREIILFDKWDGLIILLLFMWYNSFLLLQSHYTRSFFLYFLRKKLAVWLLWRQSDGVCLWFEWYFKRIKFYSQKRNSLWKWGNMVKTIIFNNFLRSFWGVIGINHLL